MVPLFPELKPYLSGPLTSRAGDRVRMIIPLRDATSICGLSYSASCNGQGEQWPKLFQIFAPPGDGVGPAIPMHVVCAWIGNSEPVAAKPTLPSDR